MTNLPEDPTRSTTSSTYTKQLRTKQRIWWKRLFDVQAPYRWNLRRLHPGFILDIGCGIGRNLVHMNGSGVGIDHNEYSIGFARDLGLNAYTPDEFQSTDYAHRQYDSLLLSHVAEHMTQQETVQLLKKYIHLMKPGGKLIMITPQEAGFKSDPTHIEFMDFSTLDSISRQLGLVTIKQYSFPFPRIIGRIFTYNEFISVSFESGDME